MDKYRFFLLFTIVGLAGFFVSKIFDSDRLTNLVIDLPTKGKIELKVGENSNIDLITLMEHLFEGERKADMLTLAKTKYRLYQIDDSALHKEISEIAYSAPLAQYLRELRDKLKGPFKMQKQRVHISVVNSEAIQDGTAAVCANGDLFRQTLILTVDNSPGMTKVGAWSFHADDACYGNIHEDAIPLIKINQKTARKILSNRPFSEQNLGYATVIPTTIAIDAPSQTSMLQSDALQTIALNK